MKQVIPSEHYEQREFVRWFRQTYKDVRIFAIPNGGARSVSASGRLKAEGVSPGVPDLFVPEWRLWIEMKRQAGGVLSKQQKDWISYLALCGYKVVVANGCEAARQHVLDTHHAAE